MEKLKTILRPVVKQIRTSYFLTEFEDKHFKKKEIFKTLIVPADAPGGLGDDAMTKASISEIRKNNYLEDISILAPGNCPFSYEPDKQVSVLRQLNSWRHPYREVERLDEYKNILILGADILDGAINFPEAIKKIKMARYFERRNQLSRIIGFSLNERPDPKVIEEFNNLNNVSLYLRDPLSFKRAKKHIKADIKLSADVAFLLEPKESNQTKFVKEFCNDKKKLGDRVIGINIHSMLSKFSKIGTTRKLVNSIATLINRNNGCSFVLIPHDYRKNFDDRTILKDIISNLSIENKKRVLNLDFPLVADEIKDICKYLDGVLTGRMHIAIAALGVCVPVLGIVYQGKFEGTFSHFGLNEDFAFSPEQMSDELFLQKIFADWVTNLEKTSHLINENLPQVTMLAKKNFEGMA